MVTALQPCQSLALLIGPSYLLPSHVLSLANSGAKILNLREASCASAHLESFKRESTSAFPLPARGASPFPSPVVPVALFFLLHFSIDCLVAISSIHRRDVSFRRTDDRLIAVWPARAATTTTGPEQHHNDKWRRWIVWWWRRRWRAFWRRAATTAAKAWWSFRSSNDSDTTDWRRSVRSSHDSYTTGHHGRPIWTGGYDPEPANSHTRWRSVWKHPKCGRAAAKAFAVWRLSTDRAWRWHDSREAFSFRSHNSCPGSAEHGFAYDRRPFGRPGADCTE